MAASSESTTPTPTPRSTQLPALLPSLSLILPPSSPPSAPHLLHLLTTLLEPSPPITQHLVPTLLSRLSSDSERPTSLVGILDLAEEETRKWPKERKAELLRAHPRIGDSKGASSFSKAEQGQADEADERQEGEKRIVVDETPPDVMARLAFLNALYEHLYPSLRFLTFVNGRSRAAIIPTLESVTGWPSNAPTPSSNPASPSNPSTSRPPSGYFGRRESGFKGPPDIERLIQAIGGTPHAIGDEQWERECERGLGEVWEVARDRVEKCEREGRVGLVRVERGEMEQ